MTTNKTTGINWLDEWDAREIVPVSALGFEQLCEWAVQTYLSRHTCKPDPSGPVTITEADRDDLSFLNKAPVDMGWERELNRLPKFCVVDGKLELHINGGLVKLHDVTRALASRQSCGVTAEDVEKITNQIINKSGMDRWERVPSEEAVRLVFHLKDEFIALLSTAPTGEREGS